MWQRFRVSKTGPHPTWRPPAGRSRDLRIDLLRGLALWMIFVDHIPENPLRLVTYHQLGFSDAAEIFIFLSGVSSSLAYGRIVARQGLPAAQRRAWRRALQIYLGYALVAVFSFAVVVAYHRILGDDYVMEEGFGLLLSAPARGFMAASYLYYTPGYLDILPLYLVLISLAPCLLYALRRWPTATLGASASVWLVAALEPQINLPNLVPSGVASFNPFSWQLLFCLGAWVGEHYYAGGRIFRPSRHIAAICGVVILANLVARGIYDVSLVSGRFHFALIDGLHTGRRGDESFVRLAHFLAVAYLVAGYALRPDAALPRYPWARPLIWCGQRSLQTFCLGIALSELAILYFRWRHPGLVDQILTNIACVALMVIPAWALRARHSAATEPRAIAGAG